MQDFFLHSRFFPLSVFAVITAFVVVAFQYYTTVSIQTVNTGAAETYSFEAPGQLEQQAHDNAFSGKSAEELQIKKSNSQI